MTTGAAPINTGGTVTGTITGNNALLATDISTEGNEVYRLQADGHVHIFTATDHAQGGKATYDLDQSVMVIAA